jgi:hypothetical protein
MKDIVKAMLLRRTDVLLARRSSGGGTTLIAGVFQVDMLKQAKHWMMLSCVKCKKRSG